MNKKLVKKILLMLLVVGLFSCKSFDFENESDQAIIDRGVKVWNFQGPKAARYYWTNIKDSTLRKRYIKYIDDYKKSEKELNKLVAKPPENDNKHAEAYAKIHSVFSSYPDSFKLSRGIKSKMLKVSAYRAEALLKVYRVTDAQNLLKSAVDTYGEAKSISEILEVTEILYGSVKAEKDAKAIVQKARNTEDFFDKISLYDDAIKYTLKAEKEFSKDSEKIIDSPYYFDGASNLKKRRQKISMEMEKKLRERQYSFKDRIGEEFARVPEGKNLSRMSLSEILAFQEEIRANVDEAYNEMKKFSEKFPKVIDKHMLKEVATQKAVLESKIAKVKKEIQTAKDIASRGNTVMPVMIGLFNAVPGGTKEDKKSRPAILRGQTKTGSDFWWGMIDIPTGTLNDLVITMENDHPVRVFGENTKSGRRIKDLKNLVNKGYKVGNSSPVLNAGNQLPKGLYFIEVQEGTGAPYKGEAVVYSSFIMRMR